MCNLNYDTTDSQTCRTDFRLQRGRDGRRMDWESGVGGYKLLHLEWINKALLYSTENYNLLG